ncbi:MAG: histidine phosphatase family protein [Chloroflexi bacterium]|nr:histidine phosphatase family protein [Chloroflexota bacterium]
MTRLILVRHGQTNWNVEGRYQGKTDVPLNAWGLKEAARLAETLRDWPIAAVYSSALSRAYQTAEAVAVLHGLAVVRDARLNEMDQGEWEGLLYGEILECYGAILSAWVYRPASVRLPGGETLAEVRQRVLAALAEIASSHPRHTVCIVGHKVTNAILKCHCTGARIAPTLRASPPNAGYEEIAY